MKSILVDALRQSQGKESESTLSDSGSYDTTKTELGPTANDENLPDSNGPADDLELLKTGVFEQVDVLEETGIFAEEELEPGVSGGLPVHAAANTATVKRVIAPAKGDRLVAPAAARFAPILCLGLALSSAAAWAGYDYFVEMTLNGSVGASAPYSDTTNGANNEDTLPVVGAERFPFIDARTEIDAGDTPE